MLEFTSSAITVSAGDFELKARGRVMRFDGHLKVLSALRAKDEDVLLPDVKEKEQLKLIELSLSSTSPSPSPRYSEAVLVKELEKRGIGRPSTYAHPSFPPSKSAAMR